MKHPQTVAPRRLAPDEVAFFYENGFVRGVNVCDDTQRRRNLEGLEALKREVMPKETLSEGTFLQERRYPYLYELATIPALLDCVEDLLGPDILLWGTHIACKEPGDGEYSWHQDRAGAPIILVDNPERPAHLPVTVSVWLAIDDVDRGNGAYKCIPGSHRAGLQPHDSELRSVTAPDGRVEVRDNITLRFDRQRWDPATSVYMELPAGQISIHHDVTIHMSEPNHSERRRAGVTLSYSRTDVKIDQGVWPGHRARVVRGVDTHRLNPRWDTFVDEPVDILGGRP